MDEKVNTQDNEYIKELCIELVKCEDESEVELILRNHELWEDKHWNVYGGEEGNYSTIGNQASSADVALVEKLINSVDHVLIGQCESNSIDPSSKEAPASMAEAVEKFFSVKDGRLVNIGPSERSNLAENIKLVATGKKSSPSMTVIDQGEGQHPELFPQTLLSLNKSNKANIPFVQGTFNMGSTGVLRFCGEKKLQLIVSRRKPEILSESQDDVWGFTVVRREAAKPGEKRSKYTYLAPKNKILRFKEDFIEVLPSMYPNPYGEPFYSGTLVKMFNYDITGYKTNILLDLYNRISLLTPTIALPIRFYERRKGYNANSYETTMAGLTTRLDDDRNKNLEEHFPCSIQLKIQDHHFNITLYAFKKDKKQNYSRNEGVIFSVNGQVQGSFPTDFFTRKRVNMAYLKSSILVHVDCTKMDTLSRENLFMNSRDRLTDCDLRREIEKQLETAISSHSGLKELREKRRREEIEDKLSDSKPLADILDKLLKKEPTLSKLFLTGERISNPAKNKSTKDKEAVELKRFPDYFNIRKNFTADSPKECAINNRLRVQYTTNAANDYLTRDDDPAQCEIKLNGDDSLVFDSSFNAWNGIFTLNLSLPNSVEVGDILNYRVEVSDIAHDEPFVSEIFVKVMPEQHDDKTKSKPGSRKKHTDKNKEGNDTQQSAFAIPNIIELDAADFDSKGIDELDALVVTADGQGGFDFFINTDNKYLKSELSSKVKSDANVLKSQFKFGLAILGMSLLREDDENTDRVKTVTRAIAPVFLPLISSLSELNLDD